MAGKTPQKYIENIAKYQKENTKQICIRLHKKYDADILDYLDTQEAKATYIKGLIRKDMRYNRSATNG